VPAGGRSTCSTVAPRRRSRRRIAERASGDAASPATRVTATATRTSRGRSRRGAGRGASASRARSTGRTSGSSGHSRCAPRSVRRRSRSGIDGLQGPQAVEGSRQTRLHRAAGAVEDGSRLLLAEIEEVAARQDEPVGLAEPAERREQGRRAARRPGALPRATGPRRPRGAPARRGAPTRPRRPERARRFRASWRTMRSSQGRNGAPSRNRPSARYALRNASWTASSRRLGRRRAGTRCGRRGVDVASRGARRPGGPRVAPARRARLPRVGGPPRAPSTPPATLRFPRPLPRGCALEPMPPRRGRLTACARLPISMTCRSRPGSSCP
jgi:hypothetical protein